MRAASLHRKSHTKMRLKYIISSNLKDKNNVKQATVHIGSFGKKNEQLI